MGKITKSFKGRRPDGRGAVYGAGAFLLEVTGVASGAYAYGAFPLKILGVPLCIPLLWVAVGFLAYLAYHKFGWKGILVAYSLDLALEPLAYHTGVWTWLNTYSAQIYFGSTVGNALVWLAMCALGALLFRGRNKR